MKGKLIFIIILTALLALTVACKNKSNGENDKRFESKVTIQASVKLGSGKSQALANSDLFLLDYSLIEKMKLIDRQVKQEFNLGGLEEAVRQQINYHPQVSALEKKINDALDYYNSNMKRSEAALKNLEARESSLVAALKPPFRKYISAAYSNPPERNRKLRELASKRDWDSVYYLFLNESRNFKSNDPKAKAAYNALQQSVDKNQKTFNQINKQIIYHNKLIKTLPDETSKKLERWRGQIEDLKRQVEERTGKERAEVVKVSGQRCLQFWSTTKKIPLKTDSKGISTLTLLTGKYWVAGLAEVESNKNIWDVPFEIKKSKTKIELSSQNVADIRNPELYQIVVDALSGKKPEKISEESL